MKTPLYVLALVCTCAAGYFSYSNVTKQQNQLDLTKKSKKANDNLESSIKETTGDYKGAKELVSGETTKKNTKTASIEGKDSKIKGLNGSIAERKRKLSTQQDELEEGERVITKIEALFKGENVPIDQVEKFVTDLEDERKQLQTQYDEIDKIAETLGTGVAKNEARLTDFDKRQEDRTRRLKANSVSSLITAVNDNWGFVIIKPHPDATITETSKLIVVRGSNHVGRLKINAIEPNRVIADIDYDSLAPGFRIRSGDRVILAVENTR